MIRCLASTVYKCEKVKNEKKKMGIRSFVISVDAYVKRTPSSPHTDIAFALLVQHWQVYIRR